MNEVRQTRQALHTAGYEEALADLLGLNVTDLRALELIAGEPGITPGRLADLSGLTTGAITGVLDRLEEAGFVRRRSDPDDRRSVRVEPVPERTAELAVAFAPLERAIAALLQRQTAAQREALRGFLRSALETVAAETARLRARSRGGFVGGEYSAPLAGASRGRLVLASDAGRIRLAGGAPDDELVRATFTGPMPDVRASGGDITVRYPRQPRSELGARVARLALNASIPWTIDVDGDVGDFAASLRDLRLERFEVDGDVARLHVELPTPSGTVAVRLAGDVASGRFDRPTSVPVALRIVGDAVHVRLDDRRKNLVSDGLRLESEGFASTPDRYEIEVLGDVAALRVRTA
jgi:DNA-binding MarR family transcriptional regulator